MNPIRLFAAMILGCHLSGCATSTPPATVKHVDLERYSGHWFEIARTPNWFERKCTGNVGATYTPLPDGSIRVLNSCKNRNGAVKEITGKATVVPHSGNAKLKVRFFGPIAGDYWILGLDEKNYSWALVGEPGRNYLWILARESEIEEDQYRQITKIARAAGYDDRRLIKTPQGKN